MGHARLWVLAELSVLALGVAGAAGLIAAPFIDLPGEARPALLIGAFGLVGLLASTLGALLTLSPWLPLPGAAFVRGLLPSRLPELATQLDHALRAHAPPERAATDELLNSARRRVVREMLDDLLSGEGAADELTRGLLTPERVREKLAELADDARRDPALRAHLAEMLVTLVTAQSNLTRPLIKRVLRKATGGDPFAEDFADSKSIRKRLNRELKRPFGRRWAREAVDQTCRDFPRPFSPATVDRLVDLLLSRFEIERLTGDLQDEIVERLEAREADGAAVDHVDRVFAGLLDEMVQQRAALATRLPRLSNARFAELGERLADHRVCRLPVLGYGLGAALGALVTLALG
ncbi:MAG: hypothetical protein KC620_02110 [Myxococcales bacterium]|nr:hypothetical protein [Myxococcales bacterium]